MNGPFGRGTISRRCFSSGCAAPSGWAQKKLRERQERQREIEEEMLAAFAEVLEEAAAP
jgi:hypothetical protein